VLCQLHHLYCGWEKGIAFAVVKLTLSPASDSNGSQAQMRRNMDLGTLGDLTYGLHQVLIGVLICVVLAWSMVWTGIALWMAARRDQLAWFVILLVVNTGGILEIIYIFVIAPRRQELRKP
jgi:hypothetical protein